MRRQVLVSVFAVGASLAAWCGTASAHDYGYNDCCGHTGYYDYHVRRGSTAPQTHDRYNNSHRDSYYAPGAPVYGYYACCDSYSHVRRPRYYHRSDYLSHHYRHRHYRSDYGYRRWHRDDYDD